MNVSEYRNLGNSSKKRLRWLFVPIRKVLARLLGPYLEYFLIHLLEHDQKLTLQETRLVDQQKKLNEHEEKIKVQEKKLKEIELRLINFQAEQRRPL